MAEINNVISFWVGLASFTGSAISNVNAGIRVEHKLSKAHGAGKYRGERFRKDAEKAAVNAAKNPDDIDAEINAQDKFEDFSNHDDYWGSGKASIAANAPQAPEVPGPEELPSLSLTGIVSFGMKLWAKDNLEELQHKIVALQGMSGGLLATIDLSETLAAKARYASAGNAFEARMKTLGGRSLGLRQQDFLDTGAALDAYALEHREALGAHGDGALAATGGHEIYSTMMAVMGKVEQYRTLSALARGTFDYDECARVARTQQLERANVKRPPETANRDPGRAYNRPPPVRPMSDEELAVYQQMTGTYLMVSQQGRALECPSRRRHPSL